MNDDEWLVGRRFGQWTVEAFLAQGGMAAVWRVRNQRSGELGALKVPLSRDDDLLLRAAREGRIQSALSHPNVVRCLDVVDAEGRPGVVLELVEGGATLESALAKGPLEVAEAERLFLGLLDGVEAAHAAGFVHRDIKPANVLLSPGEGDPVPKLADFGLGRPVYERAAEKLTRQGFMLGSAAYMAPEQARDAASVDARADLWSLGCVLYELLSSEPAFPGERVETVLCDVAAGRYRPLDGARPGIDARWVVAVDACLLVDPDTRVGDVATLRRIIQRQERWVSATGGARTRSVPGVASSTAAARGRPPRGVLAAAGETFPPSRLDHPPRRGWAIAAVLAVLAVLGVTAYLAS